MTTGEGGEGKTFQLLNGGNSNYNLPITVTVECKNKRAFVVL